MAGQRRRDLQFIIIAAVCVGSVFLQQPLRIPKTKFSCQGRPTGYYADLETGCQVYHMCDGLGRQFSYSCPNTTLFQQRMLICDHWYMVNCSTSEKDYSVNLLIGQRDKPFVADDEDHQRTPRPDILLVPYAQGFNNYGGSIQVPVQKVNGRKDVDESIANGNNDLSDGASQFPLPTHWSTELTNSNQYTTVSSVPKNNGFGGRPIVVQPVNNKNQNNFNARPVQNQQNNQFAQNSGFKQRPVVSHNSGNNGFNQEKVNTQVPQNNKDSGFSQNSPKVTKFTPNTGTGSVVHQNSGPQRTPQNTRTPQFNNNNNNVRPQNNGLPQNPDFSQNPGIVSTNGGTGVIVKTPSKLFEPPREQSNTRVPQQPQSNTFKRISSTTVRSIASFNNQLLGQKVQDSVASSSEEPFQLDLRFQPNSKEKQNDGVVTFINRFNPNENIEQSSLDAGKPQEPQGFEIQSSSETAGFASHVGANNHITNPPKTQTADNRKPANQGVQGKILNTPANKPQVIEAGENEHNLNTVGIKNDVIQPERDLVPPKNDYSLDEGSTTMGPPIYYEWKWAAPAFDLEPPNPVKENKEVKDNVKKEGRPDFALPKSTTQKPTTQITERSVTDQTASEGTDKYKLASYFIPDYVFPLDKQHPGYEEDGAITSFQVKIPQASNDNGEIHPYYGENAKCPQCHPSFVVPGTCKPCVMIRR